MGSYAWGPNPIGLMPLQEEGRDTSVLSLCHVRTQKRQLFANQEESSHQKLNWQEHWYWTSQSLEVWEINICCLSAWSMSVVFCYGIPSQLIQPVLCSPLMLPRSPKSRGTWAPFNCQLDESVVWQITWAADNLQLGPRECKNVLGKFSMKGTQYKLICLEENCSSLADYNKYPQENNQTKPIEK